MKIFKYILSVLLLVSAIKSIIENYFLAGVACIILALLLITPISNAIMLKLNFWRTKHWRYITYAILFLLFAVSLPKKAKPQQKPAKETVDKVVITDKTTTPERNNVETCNYDGDEYPVIPELVASDIYMNFDKRGFKIDKQIETEHTNILCTLNDSDVRYNVMAIGCSPDQIIKVTATVLDYSGKNQKEVSDFFGFVATLQYEGADPEKAKKWAMENSNNNGASTVISNVKISINFKTVNSKLLTLEAIE